MLSDDGIPCSFRDGAGELCINGGQPMEIRPKEGRTLYFIAKDPTMGPEKCHHCGVHGVTKAYVYSTVKGEPYETLIGNKCHMCGAWDKSGMQ
jgi:hypothetical protein